MVSCVNGNDSVRALEDDPFALSLLQQWFASSGVCYNEERLRGEVEGSGEYVPSTPWKVLYAMKSRRPGSLYPWSEKYMRDWPNLNPLRPVFSQID